VWIYESNSARDSLLSFQIHSNLCGLDDGCNYHYYFSSIWTLWVQWWMQLLYYYFSSIRTLWVRRWMLSLLIQLHLNPLMSTTSWQWMLLFHLHMDHWAGRWMRLLYFISDISISVPFEPFEFDDGCYYYHFIRILTDYATGTCATEDVTASSLYIRSRDHFFSNFSTYYFHILWLSLSHPDFVLIYSRTFIIIILSWLT